MSKTLVFAAMDLPKLLTVATHIFLKLASLAMSSTMSILMESAGSTFANVPTV